MSVVAQDAIFNIYKRHAVKIDDLAMDYDQFVKTHPAAGGELKKIEYMYGRSNVKQDAHAAAIQYAAVQIKLGGAFQDNG